MSSGRFSSFFGAALLAALSAGCGTGGAPCTSCPPIEGRYTLEFAEGPVPAECATLGVELPEGPLEIQRAGSQLTASVEEVELRGTLYQSYDFNLLGTRAEADGGSTSLSFSGRYSPGQADGGTGQLSGSFTGTWSRSSAQGTLRCSLSRAYTATRQGQP